jgi:CRISPR-associated protein Csb2
MPHLLLSVRFLSGRYHGLRTDGVPDWPPPPGRLFQALVAGAARGEALPEAAQEALLWLEGREPPVIAAPAARPGAPVTLMVPNNDLDAVTGIESVAGDPAGVIETKGKWLPASAGIRTPKRLRPVLFDPAVPLLYLWRVAPGEEAMAGAVIGLSHGLYQLGRGIDPAFADGEVLDDPAAAERLERHPGQVWRPQGPGEGGLPVPRDGTLASLVARHGAFLARLAPRGKGGTAFANPPRAEFARIRYGVPPATFLFELREPGEPGFAAVPEARAGALVRGLIAQAAERLTRDRPEIAGDVARFLVGRDAEEADKARRVRVIALPSIGHAQVDHGLRRVLVEVPGTCPLRARDVAWAFTGLPAADADGVILSPGRLMPAEDGRMAERYRGPARLWRSETPLALPVARRRLSLGETKTGEERAAEERRAAGAVAAALRHAGLAAHAVSVRLRREPFAARGARAEDFARGTRFEAARLWHAEIRLDREVEGPLLLGDGRFCGLGLMVPVAEAPPGAVVWEIASGLAPGAEAADLARALRRAVMALMRDERGEVDPFFSGHERDGAKAGRDGRHGHIACVADLARRRLLVLAPHLIRHDAPTPEEAAHLAALAARAPGLRDLKAGPAGRLALEPVAAGDDDPLLAPARVWESLTPFAPARHARRLAPADALAADLGAEARRHGLPAPGVDVLAFAEGPRGGLSGTARLSFATAIRGPVLLGRTLHQGGGVFAAMS